MHSSTVRPATAAFGPVFHPACDHGQHAKAEAGSAQVPQLCSNVSFLNIPGDVVAPVAQRSPSPSGNTLDEMAHGADSSGRNFRKPRLNEDGPDKTPARCSPMLCTFSIAAFPQVRVWLFDAAGDCDGLPDLGPEPPVRARLRSFRLRFSASSCLFFFFTEGFS